MTELLHYVRRLNDVEYAEWLQVMYFGGGDPFIGRLVAIQTHDFHDDVWRYHTSKLILEGGKWFVGTQNRYALNCDGTLAQTYTEAFPARIVPFLGSQPEEGLSCASKSPSFEPLWAYKHVFLVRESKYELATSRELPAHATKGVINGTLFTAFTKDELPPVSPSQAQYLYSEAFK